MNIGIPTGTAEIQVLTYEESEMATVNDELLCVWGIVATENWASPVLVLLFPSSF